MHDYFQAAYDRARARYTATQWLALDPRQITEAIYREMRQIDAELRAADHGQADHGQADDGQPDGAEDGAC